jgi:polyhydroxybutyrate depolymerase
MVIAALILLQGSHVQTFTVDGIKREAIVVGPSAKEPSPLVFAFHGHGGNMRQAQRSFEIDKLWPEAVVVYPQGLPTSGRTDPEGKKSGWQQNAGQNGDRDLAFFDAMLATIKREHKIDSKRIYVMGHSNGGRFTYLLWAKRGTTFAAVGPSASPATGLARDFKPLSAFIVGGEKDQLVPFFTQKLSMDAVRRVLEADPKKARKDGYLTVEPAPNGLELATYVFPGGHTFEKEAARLMVEFFRRHSKG